jgi:Domain of unknown function (DUF6907)
VVPRSDLAREDKGVAVSNELGSDGYAAHGHVPSGHSATHPCPDWCVECVHEPIPDGALWHRGPATTIPVYDGTTRQVPLTVRAGYLEKLPEDWSETADLQQPYVTLDLPDNGRMFTLTPAAAYETAAALISAADAAKAAHQAATTTAPNTS